MLKKYIQKCLPKVFFAALMLSSLLSWSQTAVITSIPVPTGDIANGSRYNTIYGFKVEVGNEDINLQNLTVNFAGTFPSNTPNIKAVVYQNRNTPYDPNQNTYDSYNYGQLSTTGGVNIINNWGLTLYALQTYYFFIQADFYNVGTVTGVGSTISATIPSLSAIDLSAANPVTVTGNVGSGNSYSVVNSAYIITPLAIPSGNIQTGSQYVPILGYKIEAAPNILTDIVQTNVITSISGTYVSSTDGITLRYYYSSSPTFDVNGNYSSYTTGNYYLSSNTGSEVMNSSVYSSRRIYKSIPQYVYLVVNNFDAVNVVSGHTISAAIDPKMFSPSITGAVFTGNTFKFTKSVVPTLTVLSTLNTSGFISGTYVYNNLYTFAITAPANSDFVLNNLNVSFSGLGNTITQFSTNARIYLSAGMTTPYTASNIINNPNWNYNYFSTPNTTVSAQNINAFKNETIPAGQTRYFTLATYQYDATINKSIQVLGISAINGTTFAGMSAAGGIKTTASLATFHSINTNSGLNISPYGEQLIYQFDGSTNGFSNSTQLQNLVVTLTGNVNPADIASVKLKYSTNGSNVLFTQANPIVSIANPGSNVITFTGQGGNIYYNQTYPNTYFITIQLKTPVNSTITGKTIGLAAIDPSQNFAVNSSASQTSIVGSNLQTGAIFTYAMPAVSFALNTLSGNNLLGINQSATPVYSIKINASGNALISSLNITTSGTYTNTDIQGFTLFSGNNSVFDQNAFPISGSPSNSAGFGEAISFGIGQQLPIGTTYFFVVPNAGLPPSQGIRSR